MGEPLFKVSNQHVADAGEPPVVDSDEPGTYFGYFANEYGEQAIYAYRYETGEATLRMGDAGWHGVHRVVHGEVAGLVLSKTELTWLRACWMATGELREHRQAGHNGGEPSDGDYLGPD